MLSRVGARLDEFNKQQMSHALWQNKAEQPNARFAIAHGHDMIFLKYYVREKHIAAVYRRINEPVYKDSCVKFFIGFEYDPNYYNLEFNCAGNFLGQYGCDKINRLFLDKNLLAFIDTEIEINYNQQDQVFEWELTVAIPTAVFEFHDVKNFAGMTCSLNFFKCGDDLPIPHYMAWNAFHSSKPDFHRPEYFGAGLFECSDILVGV